MTVPTTTAWAIKSRSMPEGIPMTPQPQHPQRCLKISSCKCCPNKKIEWTTWVCTFSPLRFGTPKIKDIDTLPGWCPLETCCTSNSSAGAQQRIEQVRIHRTWAMPNKNTFQIPQIKNLIKKYDCNWFDPFPDPFKIEALTLMNTMINNSQDGCLFDPPYSPRQLKECYNNNGECLHDTKSSVWKNWKDEIARVIKPGGICISFGWSTNGLGKNRGFEIVEILLVAHGGNHNDTICTVERKALALLQAAVRK